MNEGQTKKKLRVYCTIKELNFIVKAFKSVRQISLSAIIKGTIYFCFCAIENILAV